MSTTRHWQTFYDQSRAAGFDDTRARGIAAHAEALIDRLRQAIRDNQVGLMMCSEDMGLDLLAIALATLLSDRLTGALSHD